MKVSYLIRLDDACPTMDSKKWQIVETLLDKYNVKPMVGVIPHNEDPKQLIAPIDENFWYKVQEWEKKGWAIALHGYNHCYTSDEGLKGLNPLWKRSEFAGLPIEKQSEKIRKGVAILKEHGINPKYFFAPSHTYDDNTLRALKKESDIRIISDTIGLHPYKQVDFFFIPILGGKCSKRVLPGEWTFCLHPSTMKENDFKNLDLFLSSYSKRFISFDDLNLEEAGSKGLLSKALSWSYFKYRKLRHCQ